MIPHHRDTESTEKIRNSHFAIRYIYSLCPLCLSGEPLLSLNFAVKDMDRQKALEWITDALGVQDRVVTLDDTRNSVREWDSLGSLLLLSRLEEDHKIVISADDIAAIKSVQEICELLEKANAFSAG